MVLELHVLLRRRRRRRPRTDPRPVTYLKRYNTGIRGNLPNVIQSLMRDARCVQAV